MSEQLDQRFATTPMPGGGWAPIGRSSQRGKRLVRIDVDVDKRLARVEFQIGGHREEGGGVMSPLQQALARAKVASRILLSPRFTARTPLT